MPYRRHPPDFDAARRRFLSESAQLALGLGISAPLSALAARGGAVHGRELRPLADEATGLDLMALPEGFRYLSFGWTGDPMRDGTPTPPMHDGMAVVRQDGDIVGLIRNHEVNADDGAFGPTSIAWDPAASGGCTSLTFDVSKGEPVGSWSSLSGTIRNCAGGPTPWGTWLSCEETLLAPGQAISRDARTTTRLTRRHGYVFEVPLEGAHDPIALTDMGRFVHEAVAVDPARGHVYLTEDSSAAGLYRFTPETPGRLADGGRLEMLRAEGAPDLAGSFAAGQTFDVDWVEIEEPDPRGFRRSEMTPFRQGRRSRGTRFTRLEGCWWDGGRVYFSSTDGGARRRGQIWRFDPAGQVLELVYESPDRVVMDSPDNLTISPRGGLIICEDGRREGQWLLTLSQDGELAVLAENRVAIDGERGFRGDYRRAEWCGACFSPDGRWLFVNIQQPGITFAITGDWERLGL